MPTIRDDATVSASDETVDWIERQYETVDEMDMDGFLSFMAEEAQFRFGNNEPASGHDQIHRAIGKLRDSIDDLRQEFTACESRTISSSLRPRFGTRNGTAKRYTFRSRRLSSATERPSRLRASTVIWHRSTTWTRMRHRLSANRRRTGECGRLQTLRVSVMYG